MAATQFKDVLPKAICEELIATVPNMSEMFESFSGQVLPRKEINRDWSYNFYRISKDEASSYFKYIEAILPNAEIKSFRLIHYPPKTRIGLHRDGWMESDGESNHGLIIQLNDPQSYKGGHLMVNNIMMNMNIGDATLYHYSDPHEVKMVKSGNRWIANLWLMM